MTDALARAVRRRVLNRILLAAITSIVVGIITAIIVIVIRFAPHQPPPVLSPEFKQYVSANKALYVWSHSTSPKINGIAAWELLVQNSNGAFDNLINFISFHNYSKVFIFIGSVEWNLDDFKQHKLPHHAAFVDQLIKLSSIKVEIALMTYMSDATDNVQYWPDLSYIAKTVRNLNGTTTSRGTLTISELHVDQEPELPSSYSALLDALTASNEIFPTSSSMKPIWLQRKLSDIESNLSQIIGLNEYATFAEAIIDRLPATTAMCYSNQYERIDARMGQYATMLNNYAKPGLGIVETGYVNSLPQDETLHYEAKRNVALFYTKAAEMAEKYGALAVHDYAQLFQTLYCREPEKVGSGDPQCEEK